MTSLFIILYDTSRIIHGVQESDTTERLHNNKHNNSKKNIKNICWIGEGSFLKILVIKLKEEVAGKNGSMFERQCFWRLSKPSELIDITSVSFELPWWLRRWRICLQCRRLEFNPWAGKIPWRRKWPPTPVFLPGESQGQRSLVGYRPWGRTKSQTWLND